MNHIIDIFKITFPKNSTLKMNLVIIKWRFSSFSGLLLFYTPIMTLLINIYRSKVIVVNKFLNILLLLEQ
jgi:hypothetical protein